MSIRLDVPYATLFQFPEPVPLEKHLKDVLEQEVDEKYYISNAMMDYFMGVNQRPSKFPRRERFLANINRKNKDIGNSVTTNAGQRPTDNFVLDDTYKNREARITENCPTIRAGRSGLKVVEPFVVASRGRNPENPSDRTPGSPTVQRLEPKFDGTTNTLTTVQKDNYVAIRTANTKGYDIAIDGDGVDLSYPNSTTRRGRVGHGVCKTLPTSDSQGVLIKEEKNEKRHKTNEEILQILRRKIGEKAFQEWAVGGLWCILSEAVLWEKVYAQGIFESWCEQPELVGFAPISAKNKPGYPTKESVRNMWINWQDRYSSYRQQLSEQQYREFKSIVQKLPHEVTSWEEYVQDMWKASEGIGLLRQALSEIQEIWKPDAHWEVQRPSFRIRKLTPLSCYRLMGFDDVSFDRASAVLSNTQLYKTAGNSIVVNVLEAILKQLLQ